MTLAIFNSTTGRVPSAKLKTLFAEVARCEKRLRQPGCVNLIITTDRTIKSLNSKWRNKNKVTDVLSFNVAEPKSHEDVLGEVYICSSVAREQAKEYGGTLQSEILRLACHGFLHLFGYDHLDESDARKMRAKEIRYLKGITKVYY